MIFRPQFDPVALQLGPLAVHWYGLMYFIGFLAFLWLGKWRLKQGHAFLTPKLLDDLLFYGVLGVILGGRLGEVLFYQPGYYLQHPQEILMLWRGGMSFHGGFLGVLLAMALFARKHQRSFWEITDFIAPLIPVGLGAGRIGNFINGELWGRLASPQQAWAMVFPQAAQADLHQAQQSADLMVTYLKYDGLPRHPSQLYEFALEGVVLFIILWLFSTKPRALGQVSAVFLIGYGLARSICEFFRVPDAGIFGQSDIISMGQWLSLPMIIAGLALWVLASKRQHTANSSTV